jgi:hypothetical protein
LADIGDAVTVTVQYSGAVGCDLHTFDLQSELKDKETALVYLSHKVTNLESINTNECVQTDIEKTVSVRSIYDRNI